MSGNLPPFGSHQRVFLAHVCCKNNISSKKIFASDHLCICLFIRCLPQLYFFNYPYIAICSCSSCYTVTLLMWGLIERFPMKCRK